MATEIPEERSVVERQRNLWIASEQYVHGEISSDKLDQVEDTLTRARQKATIELVEYRMRWFLLISVAIWLLGIIVAIVVAIWLTNSLAILPLASTFAPPVFILYKITKSLFPAEERRYLLKKKKMRRK